MNDTNDDTEYRRVFGVKFAQPNDDDHWLTDTSITDDFMYMITAAVGVIPLVGLVFSLSAATGSMQYRHDNEFGIDEQVWKASVFGLLLQCVSLCVVTLIWVL